VVRVEGEQVGVEGRVVLRTYLFQPERHGLPWRH
jgi:hypothetical protein